MAASVQTNVTTSMILLHGDNEDGGEVSHHILVYNSSRIIFLLLLVPILVFALLGNLVVVLIVCQKPAMRSAINILLANMAMSHMLMAVVCMPLAAAALVRGSWPIPDDGQLFSNHTMPHQAGLLPPWSCQIQAALHSALSIECTFVLLIISIDRYMIIVQCKDKLSPSVARVLIVVTWTLSILVVLPPLVGWSSYRYLPGLPQCSLVTPVLQPRRLADSNFITSMLSCLSIFLLFSLILPSFLMLFSYQQIVKTVRRNALKVHQDLQTLSHRRAQQLGFMGIAPPPQRSHNIDLRFKTQAFSTILLLFFAYLVCWLPYCITLVYQAVHISHPAPLSLISTLWLTYSHAALTPTIYTWRIPRFRKACKDYLPSYFRLIPDSRRQRRVNPMAVYEMPCTIDFIYGNHIL